MSTPVEKDPLAQEWQDMQGLVRFGYRHLTQSCFLLLRVKDRVAARAWLAAAPVTSAVAAKPLPVSALLTAFTSEGLPALDVAHDIAEHRVAAAIAAGGTLMTDKFARSWWVLAEAYRPAACLCTTLVRTH